MVRLMQLMDVNEHFVTAELPKLGNAIDRPPLNVVDNLVPWA